MKQRSKEYLSNVKRYYKHRSIQFTISISFTLVSIFCMGILFFALYSKFVNKIEETTIRGTEQVLNQTTINLESYLRNMMRISDSMYYSVIKNTDISKDRMDEELALLYEVNKDNLVSIACFTQAGDLVAAAPVTNMKEDVNVTEQEWFVVANEQLENLHFSTPHVQNLFVNSGYRYHWVLSLSRMVELTSGGNIERGILVVDMNYSSIVQMFNRANSSDTLNYIYLIDSNGKIIYHPKQNLISADMFQENNEAAAQYEDGTHDEEFQDENRIVTVKSVGYTGWKIVSVATRSNFIMGLTETKYFGILVAMMVMGIIIVLNQFISRKIALPIKKLENSVMELDEGNLNPNIYIGGSYEIRHLGETIRSMVDQLRSLMDDMVKEQEEKRKNELEALQSQINPHFLYNTLDSIIWMIEGEHYEEAVFMVSELASLFRISLSKGKNVISIEDECKHAKNYMSIQKVRYKNKFEITFLIEEEIYEYSIVKLVLQPILENAIYYGMEYMDGDGLITVKGYFDQGSIVIDIIDNGLGMPQEVADLLLTETDRVKRQGSGVGLINVNRRLQLHFGETYGLRISSEPDEGTCVRILLPAIAYSDYMRQEEQRKEREDEA